MSKHTDGSRHDSNDLSFEVVLKKSSICNTRGSRVRTDQISGGDGRTMPPIIQAASASSSSEIIGRRSSSAFSIYDLEAMWTTTARRSCGPLTFAVGEALSLTGSFPSSRMLVSAAFFRSLGLLGTSGSIRRLKPVTTDANESRPATDGPGPCTCCPCKCRF